MVKGHLWVTGVVTCGQGSLLGRVGVTLVAKGHWGGYRGVIRSPRSHLWVTGVVTCGQGHHWGDTKRSPEVVTRGSLSPWGQHCVTGRGHCGTPGSLFRVVT